MIIVLLLVIFGCIVWVLMTALKMIKLETDAKHKMRLCKLIFDIIQMYVINITSTLYIIFMTFKSWIIEGGERKHFQVETWIIPSFIGIVVLSPTYIYHNFIRKHRKFAIIEKNAIYYWLCRKDLIKMITWPWICYFCCIELIGGTISYSFTRSSIDLYNHLYGFLFSVYSILAIFGILLYFLALVILFEYIILEILAIWLMINCLIIYLYHNLAYFSIILGNYIHHIISKRHNKYNWFSSYQWAKTFGLSLHWTIYHGCLQTHKILKNMEWDFTLKAFDAAILDWCCKYLIKEEMYDKFPIDIADIIFMFYDYDKSRPWLNENKHIPELQEIKIDE